MITRILGATALLFAGPILGAAWADSIDDDQLDPKQIYFGDPKAFDSPAGVIMEKIIQATPEYKEIRKKKVKPGTGKYLILLSKATDRAMGAIAEVAEEQQYDLIAAKTYLKGLDPKVAAEDATKLAVEKFK